MNYYSLTYANSTTLIIKSPLHLKGILLSLLSAKGLKFHRTIYNPKSYLTLSQVPSPDERQRYVACDFDKSLIG